MPLLSPFSFTHTHTLLDRNADSNTSHSPPAPHTHTSPFSFVRTHTHTHTHTHVHTHTHTCLHVNTYYTFGRAPVSMADLRSNLNLQNHVLEYIFITRLTAVRGCGLTVSVS